MRYCECECSFTGAWGTYEEQRASREFAGLDKFDDHPTRLKGHVDESVDKTLRKGRVPRVHCSVQ